MLRSPTTRARHVRQPELTNAYLIGGGIASLAAAVHLIQDAHLPASQIHILESGPLPGGSMSAGGSPETGYILQGGQMLNFSYLCLYDLLSNIPSLTNPKKTVMHEIREFNAVPENKTHANARLVATGANGPEIVDVAHLGLSVRDRRDLIHLVMKPEQKLGTLTITDCFHKAFFKTNFWLLWATMFAFQSWHSAVEFRRYLYRFAHEISRINTLEGVDCTRYDQYDSIILPIETYLKAQGVEFKYNTKVLRLSFAETSDIKVEEIHFSKNGATESIYLNGPDIVFLTLGSTTTCASIGSNISAPAPLPSVHHALRAQDGSWELWSSLFWSSLLETSHESQLGNPRNFYSRMEESSSLWFTVTLKNPEFFQRFESWSCNAPGTGGLTTFRDSNWLMSIIVPRQPHFLNQPEDVQVFRGYALFPEQIGDIVRKPMVECTGEEIFTELLGLLNFPTHPILENSITIPYMMPYITSPFLTRKYEDRPQVIPTGGTNLALLGQFVEIQRDIVSTIEYSVRGAQVAVFEMMGVQKKAKDIYRGEHNIKVLLRALKAMFI